MLELAGVELRWGDFVLRDVSAQLGRGQYVGLMGPSGCGKSSLLEAICGLRPIKRGDIRIAGRSVVGEPPARRGVGLTPQDTALFGTMSVRGNLTFGLDCRGVPSGESDRLAEEVADVLRIRGLLERSPATLSGGEARRVAIGRAIAFRPAVLLLDEPLSGLDEETKSDVEQALIAAAAHSEATVLHVTHDPGEVARLADRLLRIEHGRVVEVSSEGSVRPRLDGSPAAPRRPEQSVVG